jgi:SAM-dependent methyltransferase
LSISYDPSRFAALAAVEKDHFWFRSRACLIVWALRKHFPRAQSLLEVGCGGGNVLAAIRQSGSIPRIVGAEAHAEGLALAARRAPGVELVQMDARRIPFRGEFDVVGAFDVIEHIEEEDEVLAGMFAACRPGGGVLITVPQHAWLWSRRDEFAGHRRRYARRELLRKLATAGFERAWTTSFVALLLPLMALARRRKAFSPSGELEIGGAANRLLGGVMALERALIAAGVSFPAGGSLLAVAHKP